MVKSLVSQLVFSAMESNFSQITLENAFHKTNFPGEHATGTLSRVHASSLTTTFKTLYQTLSYVHSRWSHAKLICTRVYLVKTYK